jgi:hypothetical protein
MVAPKPQRSLTRAGKVFCWFMIVFVALLGVLGGVALIKDGVDSRAALADGPSGTFAPTDRTCHKEGCTWIGDFVSDDGTITRTGIELLDNVRVRHGHPMPAEIDDVRLHDDTSRSVAYTNDRDWRGSLFGGIALPVFCLTMTVFLIRMMRRHQRANEVTMSSRTPT